MIEADNLVKNFGSVVAVNDVSFQISPGEVVGFLGANGAGKSTTMRLLTGYLKADAGSARIAGHDIAHETRAAQSKFGYLPEAASGFPQLTVREFLKFSGEARRLWRKDLINAIDRTAALIELRPALDQKMAELSKGWRQRAWLAQALLHDPPILILDEPTDGLDPGQKDKVRALIRDIATKKVIILSSHILEEAEELCDRVIIIAGGKIVSDQPTSALVDERGRLAPAFRDLTGGSFGPPVSIP